jgi:hypothetical protein
MPSGREKYFVCTEIRNPDSPDRRLFSIITWLAFFLVKYARIKEILGFGPELVQGAIYVVHFCHSRNFTLFRRFGKMVKSND